MEKTFLACVLLPAVTITNTGSAQVETVVKSEVSGENASVHTEITSVVNDKETKIVATGSGEVRLEVKNGEVKSENTAQDFSIRTQTPLPEKEIREKMETISQETQKEVITSVNSLRKKIVLQIKSFFSRLANFFKIRS